MEEFDGDFKDFVYDNFIEALTNRRETRVLILNNEQGEQVKVTFVVENV